MPDILVVDDDAHIRDVITVALEGAGHKVRAAADGAAGLATFKAGGFDLVVLDVGMPELDGFEVCRAIRQSSQVPILFLTARSDEIDRVLGLELGGDDYVTKPFSPREVSARVRAILKRTTAPEPVNTVLRHGRLIVDTERFECLQGSVPVKLTASEFAVLVALMRRPDVVLTRVQLIDMVYGNNPHVSDRTLDSHIRNLRAKLLNAGCANAIKTIHGVGLKLDHCK